MNIRVPRLRLCLFAVALVSNMVPSQADYAYQMEYIRGKFLALEMIDIRCPSAKPTFLMKQDNNDIFQLANILDFNFNKPVGNLRHLLATEVTARTSMRKLLRRNKVDPALAGAPAAKKSALDKGTDVDKTGALWTSLPDADATKLNKAEWRSKSCTQALLEVEKYCPGAPGDKVERFSSSSAQL
eukprot:gene7068-8430_t